MVSLRVLVVSALLSIAGAATACNGAAPTAEQPDLVATQVAVERSAAATLTAEALTAQPTVATATPSPSPAVATATEEAPATATPTSPPTTSPPTSTPTTQVQQPTPTPTQITAVLFPVDGDDGDQTLHGSFVQSNGGRNVILPGFTQAEVSVPMVFRDRFNLRAEVFDEAVGNQDGAGIAGVRFVIDDGDGETVYAKLEETAPYCVFGGNESGCPVPTFRELNWRWPGTTLPIENGPHLATMTIRAASGDEAVWRWNFEIQHGDGAGNAAPPTVVILRPACGTTLSVAAGEPLELRYGIWANRGLERASANESGIEIELIVDGQTLQGQRMLPPVETLEGAICGRDYEDSYWVYHVVNLPGLSAGSHAVRVVYRFTRAVQDGYGGTFSDPFTQEYTLNAR